MVEGKFSIMITSLPSVDNKSSCILLETPSEVELETGSSTDDFVAVCGAVPVTGFDLVCSFTHLGDGGSGLVADNGGNDSSR